MEDYTFGVCSYVCGGVLGYEVVIGGRDNTRKNMASEVKLNLGSILCCYLSKLFNLSLSFPNHKMGLIVLTIKVMERTVTD